MAYTRMTAADAAALIKNGDTIGLSGFTPAGSAKAVTRELAKIAQAEHEAGREFKVSLFTGASTGQSTDGVLTEAHAIKYRAPYTTNPSFRKSVNMGEIAYNDIHLSHMAQELRYGFYGDIDWAIIEVCDIEEDGDIVKAYLTAAGGISPTVARLAKHVVLELNAFHSKDAKFLHDVYEPLDPPMRQPIPIVNVGDRIGKRPDNRPDRTQRGSIPRERHEARHHPVYIPSFAERCGKYGKRNPRSIGQGQGCARLQCIYRGNAGQRGGNDARGQSEGRFGMLTHRIKRVSEAGL